MAVTSASTNAAVRAQIEDNSDYDLVGSTSKAGLFIQACRMWLLRMADEVQTGDARVREDYRRISEQLTHAEQWYRANNTTSTTGRGGVRAFDLRRFRE